MRTIGISNLILPLVILSLVACSRGSSDGFVAGPDPDIDESMSSGTVLYDSSGLQILFDDFKIQPDGPAMVFVVYRNTTEDACFDIMAEGNRNAGKDTLLISDDGRGFISVQISGLQGKEGLRLYPGGSTHVAFTFYRTNKSKELAEVSGPVRYHFSSSQWAEMWPAAQERKGRGFEGFAISLAIRDMEPR